jgi:hypothetical protein
VSGPLAPFAAGYRAELARQGYSEWTAIAHLQLMEHVHGFSRSPRRPAASPVPGLAAYAGLQTVTMQVLSVTPIISRLNPQPPGQQGS